MEDTMTFSLHLSGCCKTDSGLHRVNNEDICLADLARSCFLVADGMGGNAGGEVASSIFMQVVWLKYISASSKASVALKSS